MATETKLSREDWLRRYRDRIMARTDLGYKEANEVSKAAPFEEISSHYENDPEGAADMELSYWDD